MANERAVLTLAAGNPVYWRMAINLARSFLWWHKQSDIRFYIVTDLPDELPRDLSGIEILRVPPDKLGRGFSAKLHLDELSPASKTLFVDADCLIVGNLESVFARFAGRPVSVVGGSISSGDWFGDIDSICSHFGVTELPKFNGGIYYLEQGSLASQTYYRARELEQHYDELGLKCLRGRPNDELLMAISMSLQELKAIPEDGTIMSDPQACPAELEVSVLRGRSRLVNPPPPDLRHQSWNPLHVVHPVIVHFLGDYTSGWRYRAEAKKLQLAMEHRWPVILAEGLVSGTFSAWHGLLGTIKDILRPCYRNMFGVRPVKRSNRILQ
jgi:hypothetical protein